MRHIFGVFLAVFVAIIIASCNSGQLKITAHDFEDEIVLQQNLVFTFNKDVAPDSLVSAWDTTELIHFEPSVNGRFKWNSATELVFSPETGFMPCTEYTARPTNLIAKRYKKRFGVNTDAMHFHTAPLRVTSSNISWVRGKNSSNVMVQLDLAFNYNIDLGTAVNKLKITSNGNPVNVSAENSGPGKVLSLQFMPVTDKDESTPLKVQLSSGITIMGTSKTSNKDTTMDMEIPSRFNLEITNIDAQHTGTEGLVTINTSQPVMDNNLKSMISLNPSVPFEVSLNESGFTITSPKFLASQTYQITISSRMEGAFGGKMKSDYVDDITFGTLKPAITFANTKGMYLSGAGFKNIALNIVNIPSVQVIITKVYENNLEHFLRNSKDWDYHYDRDDNEGGSYQYYDVKNLGDTIFTKTYETSKLPKLNAASVLNLDFKDKIKDYNGVYILQVMSKEHYWLQDSKIISISDMGMIVKEEKDNMYVFVNSIKNATAMSGVKVNFVSTNNQKLYTATTDNEGVAVFKEISKTSPGFHVGLVTATNGDEFSFVWMDKTKIGTSRFDVGGRSPNAAGLITMIYPERNLYRPGETMNISAIIRDEHWAVMPDVPVKIKLIMPNGREFATARKVLNEQGSCEVTFTPPNTAMTGTYTVQVFSGNDVLLNTSNISVEEFMPDRLKASVSLAKEDFAPGETVNAVLQADNLFGTPAGGRNYQCELNIDKATFASKQYDDYDFGMHNEFKFNTDHREGKTDEKGSAAQAFAMGSELANHGLLKGTISYTVFDETGRPLHRFANFNLYTQQTFIGIKQVDEYVNSHQAIKMPMAALDKKGNPVQADVEVALVKKDWHTVIESEGGSYRFISKSDDRVISNQRLHINGASGMFTFTPQSPGMYEVRVFLPGSENYVGRTVYAYGWGDAQNTSFEVNNEGNVIIKTDKTEYNEGDNVKALFTTPFDGRMLVTLEQNDVMKYYYLDVKNKTASLEFKAEDRMLPNVYITTTLFRPMDGSDLPLTVAHGFKSVPVENKSNHLTVKLTVADKSRSRTKQTISLKTEPGAYVTIAAVDEGILQIKNFASPDPYDFFYTKIALGVNSYDIYPWLLPEIKTRLSSTGGDEGGGGNGRVNPMFVNRVKNVSFWSGIQQADGSGNVKFDIDIPQFSGDIRVMAVAYKNKSFGNAEAHMKVADPVVVSTALPRFFSPKDQVTMPVFLTNTTDKATDAEVTVKVTGPLNITSSQTTTVKLPAKGEQRAVFGLEAQNNIGAGNVSVSVRAFGETFKNETDISIRPAASLQKITGNGVAADNQATPIDLTNNFLPGTAKANITIGKSPITQFMKNLQDLIQYPYGCVEQTTSAAFPQLYYGDLVKSLTGHGTNETSPTAHVQYAINKLQSMQTSTGGLTFWPDGGYESWWGSVYAAHFLVEARKAGYEVNANTINRLEEYMKFKLYKKEVQTYWYNGSLHKDIAPEEVAYSLYVLALAGKPELSSMNYYKAHQDLLTLDGRYLLSAAFALSGQPKQAREILPAAFSGEEANHAFGGSFYSYIRDLALALDVLVETDPNNKQIGVMARQLSDQMKKSRYMNTQENAFAFMAFGKIARTANKTTGTAILMAGGKKIATSNGENLNMNLNSYLNDKLSLQVNDKGGFYYYWEMEGVAADGAVKEEDSYLKVRRAFLNKDGQEVTNNTFKQNDLIVVRISIETQYNSTIDNVAITDMLPAGFEVENTRLQNVPRMKWLQDLAAAYNKATQKDYWDESPDRYKQAFEYCDIRDDRVNMFTSVGQLRKNFYYMVRAVTPGVYQLGPVQADAMYDGSYHSYWGAGVVRVNEK